MIVMLYGWSLVYTTIHAFELIVYNRRGPNKRKNMNQEVLLQIHEQLNNYIFGWSRKAYLDTDKTKAIIVTFIGHMLLSLATLGPKAPTWSSSGD